MKSKKVIKMLRLSKQTVANLCGDEIKEVKGGIRETWEQTICIICTNTCYGCPTGGCTQVNTCGCPTGATCYTCPPEACV